MENKILYSGDYIKNEYVAMLAGEIESLIQEYYGEHVRVEFNLEITKENLKKVFIESKPDDDAGYP